MSFQRKPNPFTPIYVPESWHRTAKLEGKSVDLIKAFSTLGWDRLGLIEVEERGRVFAPWREGDPFEQTPYKGEGPGYMTREELREQHDMTDADLEAKIAAKLGIRVALIGGEDTPEKRFLRSAGFRALTHVLTERG